MTDYLKPCPWCGRPPRHHTVTKCRSSEPHAGMHHGEVWHYCGGGVRASVSVYRETRREALGDAAKLWNTRAECAGCYTQEAML